jgi:hypothetical protein
MTGTPPPPRGGTRRGALLLLGGLAATAAILPAAVRRLAPIDTAPADDLPGFRRMEGESLSRAFDPFAGLEAPGTEAPARDALPEPDLSGAAFCAALFPGWSGESVPLALFTDANCGICRRTEPALLDWIAEQEGRVTLHWHDLPILAPSSVTAARAVLAARALGAEEDARIRLRRSAPAEGEAWITAFGTGLGLDGGRFATLAAGPEIGAELATGRALADRLGIYGTPGAVLGRTIVVGALPRDRWDRLLAGESAEATRAACDAAGGF